MGAQKVMPQPTPRMQGLRSRMKDLKKTDIPSDLGLLPGTYVRPSGKNLPSWFRRPKTRLKIEWKWIETKFKHFLR